jgi:eukaryotic-like serine/threonine-protein kinase
MGWLSRDAVGYARGVERGQIIEDRYRLEEPVASGGMSDVWAATDLVLGRTVAVKVILPALFAEPGFAQRFRAEAQIMAGLRHQGIVVVYDYGQVTLPEGEIAYLVMELVDGEPLSQRLAAVDRLGIDETMSIVAQAADALEAAHSAGVVHRDVKPGNLLVRPDGTVTLVDFGVAASAASTALTGPDEVPGTALYMAPEQVAKRDAAPSVDVYALGVVAYECLAGVPPFTAPTALAVAMRHVHDPPPPLPPELPEPVRDLVHRALAKDPADRFASAAVLATVARAIGSPETEELLLPGPVDTVMQPALRPAALGAPTAGTPVRRSRRRTAALMSAAVAGAIAILAVPVACDGAPAPGGEAPPSVTPGRSGATAGPSGVGGPGPSSSGPGQRSASTVGSSAGQVATSGPSAGAPPPTAGSAVPSTPEPAQSSPAAVPPPTSAPVTSAPVGGATSPAAPPVTGGYDGTP